jgi:hypothetical protein
MIKLQPVHIDVYSNQTSEIQNQVIWTTRDTIIKHVYLQIECVVRFRWMIDFNKTKYIL